MAGKYEDSIIYHEDLSTETDDQTGGLPLASFYASTWLFWEVRVESALKV